MPRHPDPVTVALPIGADLLRRLDAALLHKSSVRLRGTQTRLEG